MIEAGGHLHCLALPSKAVLRLEQFERLGAIKPVIRGEATFAICGLSGNEGGSLERTLKNVLWPYWKDPTRPVHLLKAYPPGMDKESRDRVYQELQERMFGN